MFLKITIMESIFDYGVDTLAETAEKAEIIHDKT